MFIFYYIVQVSIKILWGWKCKNWFMANKLDLSTLPKKPILNGDEYSTPDEVEEKGNYIDKMGGGYGWPLILIGMAVATVILSVYALWLEKN